MDLTIGVKKVKKCFYLSHTVNTKLPLKFEEFSRPEVSDIYICNFFRYLGSLSFTIKIFH